MIRVQLNDTTFVDVEGTEDTREAAAAARRWFQQNKPEEFEAWRRTQLGLGSSAARAASAGIDQFQSSLFSAAEGLGRAVGSTNLERFGRQGRIEQELQAEAAFPSELRQAFTDVESVGGAARATTEAVAGSLPSTAAGLAGALGGAKVGAAIGAMTGPFAPIAVPVGGVLGGIGGASLAAAPVLFGQNIRRQQEVSGDITDVGAAARAAAIQAPLESAADIATLGAARVFRRPVTEAAQAAGEGLGRRLAKGALAGAAIEAPVEVAQAALERGQAGLPVFTTEGGAGREYLESALGGAAAGGVTGGALRAAFGERPAPEAAPAIPEGAFAPAPAPVPTPAPAAPETGAAPPPPPPITLPDRPEAFTSPEEAQTYLAERNIQIPVAQPQAVMEIATAARLQDWQTTTAQTREQAVRQFFPRAPETNQLVVSDSIVNLASAANRGELNLNAFSPTDVAKAALASRDIDPSRVSSNEVRAAREQLDALAETGLIKKNVTTVPGKKGKKATKRETTTYAINFGARPEAQPAAAPTPATQAAPAAAPVPPAAEGAPVPQAAPTQATPVEGEATWQGPDADISVRVLPEAPQQGTDGRLYQRVNYEGRDSYVPADQLQQAPTPAAPQFAPDPLRNNRPANLRDTDGWKLHIGTDGLSPQQIQRLTQEVRNTGARSKLGRSGGQVGKDITIYAGSRADAERIAQQLSPFTGGRIYGDTAVDDVELAPGVGARFDVAGDRDFHQYGRGGIPILRDLIEIGKPFSDEAIQRSEAILAQRYGEFFTGRPAQPTARTTVEVNGVRRETTPETLQQTVNQMRTGQQAVQPQQAQSIGRLDLAELFTEAAADARRQPGAQPPQQTALPAAPTPPRPAAPTAAATAAAAAAVAPAPAAGAPAAPPATAAPTPSQQGQTEQETLQAAAAEMEPGSGAGKPTASGTVEEALASTPENMPLAQSRKILDKQIADAFAGDPEGFRAGLWRRLFASPLTGFSRLPIYSKNAKQGTNIMDRKLKVTTEFTDIYTPVLELSAESQGRIMLTLQEASSTRQMWNRDAFSAKENQAMDATVQLGQRGLDVYIDAATRRFFNPLNAKTPEDRARLEAFQQRKGDRLITEMPEAEIRAASREGAQEVARYQRVRNPFYLPQVSKGTHFVAAYERKPGQKRDELVRIYFYDPPKLMQKLRRTVGMQRDFEALAIAELRREFPDASRYRIMQKGRRSDQDEQAADLKRDGEFIAQYLERLSKVSSKDAQKILDEMAAEINKAQIDRFFRPNNDKLRAVTPWNATEYARETVPNFYLSLSNIQAKIAYQDDFNRALDGLSYEEKKYWNDWLNLNTTPTEAFGTGRAIAAFWFLGGNVSTAMIQMTQVPLLLPPRFYRDGLSAAALSKHYGSAIAKVYGTADVVGQALSKERTLSTRLLNRNVLNKDQREAVKRALDEGVVRPSQITTIKGQFDADDIRALGLADKSAAKFAKNANTALDLSFRFLSNVDETNRLITFIAAFDAATANPAIMDRAGRFDNRDYQTPYDYARAVTERVNFRGGREDQPLITTFHPAAQAVTQFLTPSFKLIEEYASTVALAIRGMRESDPTMARAAAITFAMMVGLQIFAAGIWSLPFADRLKELVEWVLKQADMPMDLEQELEKMAGNSLLASTLNYGFFHAIGAVTLSERMKIDVLPQGSVSEWDVFSILGPIGGFLEKPFVAIDAWRLGDYWGVAYALAPTALANVLKGAQIGLTGQQYTRAGGRIITPEQVEAARQDGLVPPEVRQALGFAPTEFTNIRRAVQRQRELAETVRDPTQRANIELAYLLMQAMQASRAGKLEEAARFSRDYQQRFQEIAREQESKPQQLRIQLDPNAIEQRAIQDLLGRGSREVLERRAPERQRPEVREMYERTVPQ